MYVCICNGVTDSQIKKAIQDGHCSEEAIGMETGAGTTCGSCLTMVNDLIDECSLETLEVSKNETDVNPINIVSFQKSTFANDKTTKTLTKKIKIR